MFDTIGTSTISTIIPICIGIGLSSATGFRVLMPFVCLSAAAVFGDVSLPADLAWLDSSPVFIGLLIGTIVEISAFYIPWVNNALDTIGIPASVVAGTYLTGSFSADLPTLLQWSIALVAGGGIAGSINGLMGVTRLAGNSATGGLIAPITASLEWISALTLTILAIAVPILALTLVAFPILFLITRVSKRRAQAQV